MLHTIYYKGQFAVCPKCGGYVRTAKCDDIILHCVDCGTFYKACGFGKAESELECEEVVVGM